MCKINNLIIKQLNRWKGIVLNVRQVSGDFFGLQVTRQCIGAKNVIFNMAVAAILILLDSSFDGKNCPRTLFSMSVSTVVQIRS